MSGNFKYIYNCWIKNRRFSIDKFYKHPGVEAHEHGDLVLFKYSVDYWYSACWNPTIAWDEIARAARGIVFNKKTGELLAKPYDKFFNINQVEETQLDRLPQGPFTSTEKLDGSLAVSYFHGGDLFIAGSGSLKGSIAPWATGWARENLKVQNFKPGYTYIFEVIHPDFRIVIDYGDAKCLKLTGVIHIRTNKEVSYNTLVSMGESIGCQVTPIYFFNSIEDILKECDGLPYDKEGYVVTFKNGLKVKIKGKEYRRVHKSVELITPLHFWESWDLERRCVPSNLIPDMPPYFKSKIDELGTWADKVHYGYANLIIDIYDEIMVKLGENCPPQVFYPYIAENYKKISSLLKAYHIKNMESFWTLVHKSVRPSGNVLIDVKEILGAAT